jgi:hypothetical protein
MLEKEAFMHHRRRSATTRGRVAISCCCWHRLFVVVAVAAAVGRCVRGQFDDQKPYTSWQYNGCETGSIDAPDSDDVFVWFLLLVDDNLSREHVVKVGAVPEWIENNQTLACRDNVLRVVDQGTMFNRPALYNPFDIMDCNNVTAAEQGPELGATAATSQRPSLCQTLEAQGVGCSYELNGVLSDGSCRGQTNAEKCASKLLGDSSVGGRSIADFTSFDTPFPIQVEIDNNRTNGTLEEANAIVSVQRNSNDPVPLSSFSKRKVWRDPDRDDDRSYMVLRFDKPRFGRVYVVETAERVVNGTVIVNQYTWHRSQMEGVSSFQVPVVWTGRVKYQVIFIPDEEICQFYTSEPIEMIVDAEPWYAEEPQQEGTTLYPECSLCAGNRGGLGQTTDSDGTTPGRDPLLHTVTTTTTLRGTNLTYTHSCDSLFIAGRRGRIAPDQCGVVQSYPCCHDDVESSTSSSSLRSTAAAAAGLVAVAVAASSFWLVL